MIDYSYMSALEDVYSRPTFSMLFQWENFAVAVLVCLVLNILCAFIPAWRASRVEPKQLPYQGAGIYSRKRINEKRNEKIFA